MKTATRKNLRPLKQNFVFIRLHADKSRWTHRSRVVSFHRNLVYRRAHQHARTCVRYLSDLSHNSGVGFTTFYNVAFAVKPRNLVKTDARLRRRELNSRGVIFSGECFLLFFSFVPSFLRSLRFSSSTPTFTPTSPFVWPCVLTATKPTRFALRPPTASFKIVARIKKANEQRTRRETR